MMNGEINLFIKFPIIPCILERNDKSDLFLYIYIYIYIYNSVYMYVFTVIT